MHTDCQHLLASTAPRAREHFTCHSLSSSSCSGRNLGVTFDSFFSCTPHESISNSCSVYFQNMFRTWPCLGSSHQHLPSGSAVSPPKCSACVSSLSLPSLSTEQAEQALERSDHVAPLFKTLQRLPAHSKAKSLPKLTRLNISVSSARLLTTSPFSLLFSPCIPSTASPASQPFLPGTVCIQLSAWLVLYFIQVS